jgi:hypothetical protein
MKCCAVCRTADVHVVAAAIYGAKCMLSLLLIRGAYSEKPASSVTKSKLFNNIRLSHRYDAISFVTDVLIYFIHYKLRKFFRVFSVSNTKFDRKLLVCLFICWFPSPFFIWSSACVNVKQQQLFNQVRSSFNEIAISCLKFENVCKLCDHKNSALSYLSKSDKSCGVAIRLIKKWFVKVINSTPQMYYCIRAESADLTGRPQITEVFIQTWGVVLIAVLIVFAYSNKLFLIVYRVFIVEAQGIV